MRNGYKMNHVQMIEDVLARPKFDFCASVLNDSYAVHLSLFDMGPREAEGRVFKRIQA